MNRSTEQPSVATVPAVDADLALGAYCIGDPGAAGRRVRAGAVNGRNDPPDTVVDAADLPGLKIRAASVRGLLHRHNDQPRQDAYSVAEASGIVSIVVCDGVGSLEFSQSAAAHVASRLPDFVLREHSVDWQEAFRLLSDELHGLTESDDAGNQAFRPMATTVLAAKIADNHVHVAWVGDSRAYLLRNHVWYPLGRTPFDSSADHEFLHSTTRALPARDFQVETVDLQLAAGDVVALLTDGIGMPLGDGSGLVGGALAEWWTNAPMPLQFAAQVGFLRRGFMDDRTAVVVWADAAHPGGVE